MVKPRDIHGNTIGKPLEHDENDDIMWVCRNVIGTTHDWEWCNYQLSTVMNIDEWGMVYDIAIPTLLNMRAY